MGNALRFLYGSCCKPKTQESDYGISISTAGVSALVRDLCNYENSSQVPERLCKYVASSRKAQAKWLGKQQNRNQQTAEQASRLVIQTLKEHLKADVEVDANAVGDGDGCTVYVDAADPNVAPNVPEAVRLAVLRRSKACLSRDHVTADALQQKIIDADYRVDNKDIRMRGIDAPEMQMPYGKEAKAELTKLLQGKCLTIGVYGDDQYGRLVGDIHCNGEFAQETMLREGHAWHYEHYDERPEFKKWASPNPQKPWEWRKKYLRD
ncbi:hypothetical protein MKX01_004416 [Papaver californicum]|nr:hypothetical protein MKX01_004416 [Papaver californicum]